jgi:hypothetical protein
VVEGAGTRKAEGGEVIRLIVLGGSGDAYLICALASAFERKHGRPVTVVMREKFGAVAELFPSVRVAFDEALVHRAENDPEMQRTYQNDLLSDDAPFYAHPCFVRSPTRVDHLTTKRDASQADMYRMVLGLPIETSLALPTVPVVRSTTQFHAEAWASFASNTVLLITDAVSWPNTQPRFWADLEEELRATGRHVLVNDKSWQLQRLLWTCAAVEWVIGPQCGVMSILCTGRFPCRKTLASPSVDDERSPGFLAGETFPYAYVTKFANEDYDVEEFKITTANRRDLVRSIVTGANAQRLWPHDPRPVVTLHAPLSPGDALDRLAVLKVKRDRFPPARRAAIQREFFRYMELTRGLRDDPRVAGLFARLVINHEATFDLLERLIPAVMQREERGDLADHVEAIRKNRERTDLKREIDVACRAPYTEVKSYYGPEDTV